MMSNLINEIMDRGIRNKGKYISFLKKLKQLRKIPLERLFNEAHDEAFSQIDCLECGRCCRELGPRLNNKDVTRLARRERLKPADFIKTLLKTDDDNDLVFKKMPCPFLGSDNYCFVYEDRPDACRDYPHMDHGRQTGRISLHIENLSYCPAVILAVEELMKNYH